MGCGTLVSHDQPGMPSVWRQADQLALQGQADAENDVIADWPLRLTSKQRNWGFCLCFLYLRNLKDVKWHHKRVQRIYRKLALNLRLKPRHRLCARSRCHRPCRPRSAGAGRWTSCMRSVPADAASAVQGHRRFQSIGIGNRGRFLAATQTPYQAAGSDYQMAWQTQCDPLRQRPRVHRLRSAGLRRRRGIRIDFTQPGQPQQNAYVNATTAPCARIGSLTISSKRSTRSRNLPPAGCKSSITTGRTWHAAAPRQNRKLHLSLKLGFQLDPGIREITADLVLPKGKSRRDFSSS